VNRTTRRRARGSALAIVLAVIALIAVEAVTLHLLIRPRLERSMLLGARMKTFYIAEAGMVDAFQKLAESPSWRAGFANKPFAGGTYSATITDSGSDALVGDTAAVSTPFILGSGAIVERLRSTVVNLAPVTSGPDSGAFRDSFSAVAYANNDGTVDWNSPWRENLDDSDPFLPDENTSSALGILNSALYVRKSGSPDDRMVERDFSVIKTETTVVTFTFSHRSVRNATEFDIAEVRLGRKRYLGGGNWSDEGEVIIATFPGTGEDTPDTFFTFDITADVRDLNVVKIGGIENGGNKRWHVFDNVAVVFAGAAGAGYVPEPATPGRQAWGFAD
jgi:hypothetical protein